MDCCCWHFFKDGRNRYWNLFFQKHVERDLEHAFFFIPFRSSLYRCVAGTFIQVSVLPSLTFWPVFVICACKIWFVFPWPLFLFFGIDLYSLLTVYKSRWTAAADTFSKIEEIDIEIFSFKSMYYICRERFRARIFLSISVPPYRRCVAGTFIQVSVLPSLSPFGLCLWCDACSIQTKYLI